MWFIRRLLFEWHYGRDPSDAMITLLVISLMALSFYLGMEFGLWHVSQVHKLNRRVFLEIYRNLESDEVKAAWERARIKTQAEYDERIRRKTFKMGEE